jgi:hypothetical protein
VLSKRHLVGVPWNCGTGGALWRWVARGARGGAGGAGQKDGSRDGVASRRGAVHIHICNAQLQLHILHGPCVFHGFPAPNLVMIAAARAILVTPGTRLWRTVPSRMVRLPVFGEKLEKAEAQMGRLDCQTAFTVRRRPDMLGSSNCALGPPLPEDNLSAQREPWLRRVAFALQRAAHQPPRIRAYVSGAPADNSYCLLSLWVCESVSL